LSMLRDLPGVDINDPSIQAMLAAMGGGGDAAPAPGDGKDGNNNKEGEGKK
jgi:hypothetical protein